MRDKTLGVEVGGKGASLRVNGADADGEKCDFLQANDLCAIIRHSL